MSCERAESQSSQIYNDPGQDSIRYRMGTYQTFLNAMVRDLSRFSVLTDSGAQLKPLAALTTRDPTDPTLALLEAVAVTGDIITLYQELFANEGFIRTADSFTSLVQLSRTVGYKPKPALSAQVPLSFRVDSSGLSGPTIDVPQAMPVQAVPKDDETEIIVFETNHAKRMRPEWNSIPLVSRSATQLSNGATSLWVEGSNLPLAVGDTLAFYVPQADGLVTEHAVRKITTLTVDAESGRTRLVWGEPLSGFTGSPIRVIYFQVQASVFGASAPDWVAMLDSIQDNYVQAYTDRWGAPAPAFTDWPDLAMPRDARQVYDPSLSPPDLRSIVALDTIYPAITSDSYVLLSDPATSGPGSTFLNPLDTSNGVTLTSYADFTLTSQMTQVQFRDGANLPIDVSSIVDYEATTFNRRSTTVEAASVELEPASEPMAGLLNFEDEAYSSSPAGALLVGPLDFIPGVGDAVVLTGTAVSLHIPLNASVGHFTLTLDIDSSILNLFPGQILDLLSGGGTAGSPYRAKTENGQVGVVNIPSNAPLAPLVRDQTLTSEAIRIAAWQVVSDSGERLLSPQTPLIHSYRRESVTLNFNVVDASHGESRTLVLGDGQASTANQSFTIRDQPISVLSAQNESGQQTSLRVSASGVPWTEAASFYETGNEDEIFVTESSPNGNTQVAFGDGIHGARLPSGEDNVTASFRVGSGPKGNVISGRLRIPLQLPLGVSDVVNNVAAAGGSEGDTAESIRSTVPASVRNLGRVVAKQDYAEFALARPGIAKANARVISVMGKPTVLLVVADSMEQPVTADTAAGVSLINALNAVRPNDQPMALGSFSVVEFYVGATLYTSQSQDANNITENASAALLQAYSFEVGDFGNAVTASDIISLLNHTKGVTGVDLDYLTVDGPPSADPLPPVPPSLRTQVTTQGGFGLQILVLRSPAIVLKVVTQ